MKMKRRDVGWQNIYYQVTLDRYMSAGQVRSPKLPHHEDGGFMQPGRTRYSEVGGENISSVGDAKFPRL